MDTSTEISFYVTASNIFYNLIFQCYVFTIAIIKCQLLTLSQVYAIIELYSYVLCARGEPICVISASCVVTTAVLFMNYILFRFGKDGLKL